MIDDGPTVLAIAGSDSFRCFSHRAKVGSGVLVTRGGEVREVSRRCWVSFIGTDSMARARTAVGGVVKGAGVRGDDVAATARRSSSGKEVEAMRGGH